MDELAKRLRASVDGRHEKCDGCPYEEDYPCCVDCLDKMHKQAADAIEELSKPRWIPVTERLPEHGWYLAYGPEIKTEVLHFHSVEEVWASERYYGVEVTHWMPLPEPPKEERAWLRDGCSQRMS